LQKFAKKLRFKKEKKTKRKQKENKPENIW
jgi:hypothetical protein